MNPEVVAQLRAVQAQCEALREQGQAIAMQAETLGKSIDAMLVNVVGNVLSPVKPDAPRYFNRGTVNAEPTTTGQ